MEENSISACKPAYQKTIRHRDAEDTEYISF